MEDAVKEDKTTWLRTWQAYRMLLGCWFLMLNSWGIVNTYGTFASFYQEHLISGQDLILINLIGLTRCFIVLFLSFAMGQLLDAGYSRRLLGAGFVLNIIGMFMLSLSSGDGTYNQGDYAIIWTTHGFVSSIRVAKWQYKFKKQTSRGLYSN